jgi:hypothetical protein
MAGCCIGSSAAGATELPTWYSNRLNLSKSVRQQNRVKENWLKMYDKAGSVLRVEIVINSPEEFKVRKRVTRKGKEVMEWVPMRKGVAYLFRYQEVSRQANQRYLDALAVVDDPTPAIQQLDDVTTRKIAASGRGVRAFNPLSRDDTQLFKAMMAGEHCIRGLSNADIRARLEDSPHLRDLAYYPRRQSARSAESCIAFTPTNSLPRYRAPEGGE